MRNIVTAGEVVKGVEKGSYIKALKQIGRKLNVFWTTKKAGWIRGQGQTRERLLLQSNTEK